MTTPVLEEELQTYEDNREKLLGSSKGKFVLIKGAEVVGVFDSQLDAIGQGYEKFGNVPFLVKQILEVETPQNFTSNLIRV
ncbi:MAG: hypothetical protein HY700_10275 [Gemmatimonadetes bacterium]|nr:hypothetical protein [Gemmatimonadota bacterium]